MVTATCEVTLPPAADQPVSLSGRVVTIAGTTADGSQNVAVGSTGPITIRAGLDSAVTVSVVDVSASGKQSAPCSITFTPHEHADPLAADPKGFRIAVKDIADEAQAATPEASVPPAAPEMRRL